MNILVTGGAGFIGSNFAELALAEGHDVTVLDALTYAGFGANVPVGCKFIKADICSPDIMTTIQYGEFDLVVNFAAETHVDNSIEDSSPFLVTNVLGVHNLLESLLTFSHKTRFVQVSTDEVYGSVVAGSFHEDSPLRPSNPYSASKASADLLCGSYVKTHGMDIVITRCSNNYGPRQHPEKLIPKCIERLQKGEKIQLYGSGHQKRDWIHVHDHCLGIMAAATKGKAGSVYNFGGNCCITNEAVAQLIVLLYTNSDDMAKYIENVADRPGHDFAYSMDYSKAERELGWTPQRSFHMALFDLIGKSKPTG